MRRELTVHTLACEKPSRVTLSVRRFWSKEAKRVVIQPQGELKVAQSLLRKSIADRTTLHPNHYGAGGRSPYKLIWELLDARAKKFCVGIADVPKAFLNVSQKQLGRDLAQSGVPQSIFPLLGLTKNLSYGKGGKKPHRGLPQGFNTSPVLFARFIDSALRRINNGRYNVFIYADNLFWTAPTFQSARRCQKYIEKCLSKRGLILHKEGKKGAAIFRPGEAFIALGLTINVRKDGPMMSDTIHDDLEIEPVVKAPNARHCYNTILNLKKQAALSQSSNFIVDDLELLAPTTHIGDSGIPAPDPNKWFTYGYEPYMDSSTNKHWSQRLRTIESGLARLDKVSLEKMGAVGGSLFSTYSKKQQHVMRKLCRSLKCSADTCQTNLRKFLEDPIRNDHLYSAVRDELWSLYVPFSGIDTLTKIAKENDLRQLRRKYEEDSTFATFIRHCYVNELNLIHQWAFTNDPISIAPSNSKNIIQQILRGHATAKMILISQPAWIRVPHLAEFEIGKFKFPILGFNDGSASEIEDLAHACEALASGFAVIPVFKEVVADLIHERAKSHKLGNALSCLREPSDYRIRYIYMEKRKQLEVEYPQLKNLPDDLDKIVPLWSPKKLAQEFKMPTYRQQVSIRVSRGSACAH